MTLFTKKRFRFEVTVGLEDLTSVPFVNGVIFAKLRIVNVRHSSQYSSREEINKHRVRWNSKYTFQCKMSANPYTNVLEPFELKISLRKEIKGGKSHLKVGFVSVNLACFAAFGEGPCPRRYILDAYNQSKRQDNSMLQINFSVRQIMGDTCFRVPDEDLSRCIPYDVDTAPRTSMDAATDDSHTFSHHHVHPHQTLSCGGDQAGQLSATTNDYSDNNDFSSLEQPGLTQHGHQSEDDNGEVDCVQGNSRSAPQQAPSTAEDVEEDFDDAMTSVGLNLMVGVRRDVGHMRSMSSAETSLPTTTELVLASLDQQDSNECCGGGSSIDPGTTEHHQFPGHTWPEASSHSGSHYHQSAVSGVFINKMMTGAGTASTSTTGYRTHSRHSSLDCSGQCSRYSSSSTSINDRSLDRKREWVSHNWKHSFYPLLSVGFIFFSLIQLVADLGINKQHQLDATRIDNDLVVSEILKAKSATTNDKNMKVTCPSIVQIPECLDPFRHTPS